MRRYFAEGEPWVWLTASAVALVVFLLVGVIGLVLANGIGHFWPRDVYRIVLPGGENVVGRVLEHENGPEGIRYRVRTGNRDIYGDEFRWIEGKDIQQEKALAVAWVERLEYGPLVGEIVGLDQYTSPTQEQVEEALANSRTFAHTLEKQYDGLAACNNESATLQKRVQKSTFQKKVSGDTLATQIRELENNESRCALIFSEIQKHKEQFASRLTVRVEGGREVSVSLLDIVRLRWPSRMGVGQKLAYYGERLSELLTEQPRESNTEGGIFPAIFGTVAMVILMSFFSMPLGVITAIYLREYATEGRFLQLVRIAVNNLAGVPSIVYGVFGLGFFVYGVGAAIDQTFFSYLLPTPVFGTGGILWASLTLAILTVPVVIVATEESLAAIPKDTRDASLALGATKFQTLVRVLLPMSMPGILTGFILSMARAAGEVAPLMLTGAVKLAPAMPVDGIAPYVHLDRKFMHLGFHIYDLAFQSPNVEAVLPMVYVTTGLLLFIVITLCLAAIILRNRMRKKIATGAF